MTGQPTPEARDRPVRIRVGALEMRRGKVSGVEYLVGFFGAVRIVARRDSDWQPDPDAPEVIAGYGLWIEELPDRSPYRERVERAGRRPDRAAALHAPPLPSEPPPMAAPQSRAPPAKRPSRKAQTEAAARDVLKRLNITEMPDDAIPF